MQIRILFSGFVVLLAGIASGQDIHFSQFNASPLNLNPSLSGLFEGDHRFMANHRNQWSSVSTPFLNFSFAYDSKLFPAKIKNDILGAGIVINQERAGDSKLSELTAGICFSFTKALSVSHNFSLGIRVGMGQRSLSYSNLVFDSQYDGDAYNSLLPTGENTSGNRVLFPDVSGGINHLFTSEGFTLRTGLVLDHLNTPVISFMNDDSEVLGRKLVLHSTAQTKVSDKFYLYPFMLLSKQGRSRNTVLGLNSRYMLGGLGFTSVFLGSSYRLQDAVILMSGLSYDNLTLGMSYDINISELNVASNGRGGYELSLLLTFPKTVVRKYKNISCPTFL